MKVENLPVEIKRVGVRKAKAIEQTSCQLHKMILGSDELPRSGQNKKSHTTVSLENALFTSTCSAFQICFQQLLFLVRWNQGV